MILLLGAPIGAKDTLAANLAHDFQPIDHHQVVRDALASSDETSSSAKELRNRVASGKRIPGELEIDFYMESGVLRARRASSQGRQLCKMRR